MTERSPRRRALRSAFFGFIGGGAIGALAAATGQLDKLEGWSAGEIATLVIGAALLAVAAIVAFATTSASRFKAMVDRDAEADEPVEPAAIGFARGQALVSAIAGVLLVAVPFVVHAGLDIGGRIAAAAAVFGLLAVQTHYNLKLWREGDELSRAVMASAGAACFWGLQFLLFIYATLAALELAPEIDAWSMFAVLMAVYLTVSSVIAVRRGAATM